MPIILRSNLTEIELLSLSSDSIPTDIELFHPNYFYSFSSILKYYSCWPLPLPVVIPHGVDFGYNNIFGGEAESGLPAVFCYQKKRESVYRRLSNLKVVTSASPWLYLLKLKSKKIKNEHERLGIVVFPPHSSVTIDTFIKSEQQFVEKVLRLKQIHKEVVVCLYWLDIIAGRHKPYLHHGIEVTTAGNMLDSNFLLRLFEILNTRKSIFTPWIAGSHVFYAASLGLDIIVDESFEFIHNADDDLLSKDVWIQDNDLMAELRDKFIHSSSAEKKEFALQCLGTNNIKSRLALFLQFLSLSFKNFWIFQAIKAQIINTYGFPFIGIDQVEILDWGPKNCKVGHGPNMQLDGSSALWLKINPRRILGAGDLYLDNEMALKTECYDGMITASFNSKIFNELKKMDLRFKNKAATKSLFIGTFTIE